MPADERVRRLVTAVTAPGAGAGRRRAAHGIPRAAARHRGPRPHLAGPARRPCRRRPPRSPTSRRPRSRRPWPSRAPRWGRMPDRTRLAVIAMGKTGGCELNYISDVDVIFVAEPARGCAEEESTARRDRPRDPADADLLGVHRRPGRSGRSTPPCGPRARTAPLVRTVASHRAYYERWAKTWEFQALLKARPVAGDPGSVRRTATRCSRWCGRPRAARTSSTTCRRCAAGSSSTSPPAEADRQIKLGPGGLRDVEFSVQLLQLVHGRADESLRTGDDPRRARGALAPGATWGATTPRRSARPTGCCARSSTASSSTGCAARTSCPRPRATCAGSVGPWGTGRRRAEAVVAQWRAQQREVRRLHERIFYRPLLSAVARLSDSDVRLTPEAARERLSALGFRDPRGALRHLEALTEGISRRAAIQRQLLPVMLGWFADEADPDAGLLGLPQDQRPARLDALVPAAAARRGVGGRAARAHPGPQPVRRRPARAGAGVRAVPR